MVEKSPSHWLVNPFLASMPLRRLDHLVSVSADHQGNPLDLAKAEAASQAEVALSAVAVDHQALGRVAHRLLAVVQVDCCCPRFSKSFFSSFFFANRLFRRPRNFPLRVSASGNFFANSKTFPPFDCGFVFRGMVLTGRIRGVWLRLRSRTLRRFSW